MKFTNWALSLQLVSTIILGIFLSTMPITVPSFYSFHYDELVMDRPFRKLWGAMYFGLVDNDDENRRTIMYKYPALFFTRRGIFALLVVWLHDWFVAQFLFLLICSYAMLYIIMEHKPNMLRSANRIEFCNEIYILALTYLIMAFGG